jgi:benzoylformate decarboxylase
MFTTRRRATLTRMRGKHVLYRQRFGAKPERGYPNMDLVGPDLGFVELARGLGVEAVRVTTPGELRPALDKALAAARPFLLDVAIEGRA